MKCVKQAAVRKTSSSSNGFVNLRTELSFHALTYIQLYWFQSNICAELAFSYPLNYYVFHNSTFPKSFLK
ncbi:hypothetical protein DPMN_038343 [Dreissena polymorpha]|uniref:Uncharacterized protein n=1 Tax=Dreissena polymorpha TaxID=45954 RepID=A0A9D4MGW3_DREPO|nr:hypothetical protein DPMN_038343 [Dreissena polymorpha]